MLRTNTKVVNLYQDYHPKVSTFFRTTHQEVFCAKNAEHGKFSATSSMLSIGCTFHLLLEHGRNKSGSRSA